MKRRAMKKWIPKKTMYCYNRKGLCKWYKFLKSMDDHMIISREDGRTEEVPYKRDIYVCQYTKDTTDDDILLFDECKCCFVSED